MVKGAYIKCSQCNKPFWLDIILNFGARENENDIKLLNCFLDAIRFYFECPYCYENQIVEVKFFGNKKPEMRVVFENPDYIG